jgi:hypothetical protein
MLGFEPERIPSVRHREHRAEHFAKTIFRCTVIVRDDKVNMQKCRDLDYRSICFFLSRRAKEPCTRSLPLHRAIYDMTAPLIASHAILGLCWPVRASCSPAGVLYVPGHLASQRAMESIQVLSQNYKRKETGHLQAQL